MSGPVKLNGSSVYAHVAPNGDGLLVRVSADDWERLGLVPSQQVRVELAGRDGQTLLLSAADEIPPVVWLRLTPLASRRAS